MESKSRKVIWRDISLLSAVGLLIMVWPTAHSIALRNLLLVVTLVLCLTHSTRFQEISVASALRSHPASFMLLAITAWVLFHIMALSLNPKASWEEFIGQWGKAIYCFVLGIIAAWRIPDVHRWSLVAVLALLFHLFIWIAETLFVYGLTGIYIPRQTSLYGGDYGVVSYISTLLMVFLLGDAMCRGLCNKRLIPVHALVAICISLFALAWLFLLGSRNGFLVVSILLTAATVFILRNQRMKSYRHIIAGLGAILIAVVMAVTLKFDERWSSFSEKVSISWNLASSPSWYTGDDKSLPQLSDGTHIDASTYYRVSWLHAGINFIEQHPMGVGFSRHAFGIARHLEHPDAPKRGYSHSSLIDWTLGIGIPGIFLWIIALAKVSQKGAQEFSRRHAPAGVLLTLLIVDYFARSIIDSNMRDHSLEMFMFFLGLFGTLLPTKATKAQLPNK